ncbi:MAG TPA: halocarboxylic acid dehydrogenase DehI family protein, partial [Terriglobales bacterium]|nr:halocarboxylic acid dehydrogenase DehI family protein [Terriglobales bacterium]
VNFFFRVLANYPSYFIPAWTQFNPCLRTLKLERAADEIRSAALLQLVPDGSRIEWANLGDLSTIRPFTDTIHYVLPKLLLTATAFHETFQTAYSGERECHQEVPSELCPEEIPPGIASGTATIPMVSPREAKGDLSEIFRDIQERHCHPGVATYYRSLARWPRFLAAVWENLKPIVQSPDYERRKEKLAEQSMGAVRSYCPLPIRQAVWSSRELEELKEISAVFRFRLIPDLLLDVALVKAMIDGPDSARGSRFSFRPTGGHP